MYVLVLQFKHVSTSLRLHHVPLVESSCLCSIPEFRFLGHWFVSSHFLLIGSIVSIFDSSSSCSSVNPSDSRKSLSCTSVSCTPKISSDFFVHVTKPPLKKQAFVSQDLIEGFSVKRECANTTHKHTIPWYLSYKVVITYYFHVLEFTRDEAPKDTSKDISELKRKRMFLRKRNILAETYHSTS
jgi:hypothetical protein